GSRSDGAHPRPARTGSGPCRDPRAPRLEPPAPAAPSRATAWRAAWERARETSPLRERERGSVGVAGAWATPPRRSRARAGRARAREPRARRRAGVADPAVASTRRDLTGPGGTGGDCAAEAPA